MTTPPFHDALHVKYIRTLGETLSSPSSYEGAVTEHLRMSGVYWSLAGLSLLRPASEVTSLFLPRLSDRLTMIDWVFACYDPHSGGFGGNCSSDDVSSPCAHDAHILYTLSALQILAITDCLEDERLDREAVVQFVAQLQNEDGSFCGDRWGEVDTRFTYCAFSCLALLGRLPLPLTDTQCDTLPVIDCHKAVRYIIRCRNTMDGGFGAVPGAESHAGQVFCCIGALSIAHSLHLLEESRGNSVDLLLWWLAERQCDSGGLNGRPEKQADVCYSWWILSSLSIMGAINWINTSKLTKFILNCQDDEDGGIADRPNDMADVYHTFFGLCGLSLIGHLDEVAGKDGTNYRQIDPVFALPTDVVQKLGLKAQVMVGHSGQVDERLKMHSILDLR